MRFDSLRLDGKVAVITGASRNIGAALARGFAEAGADLLLVARGAERLRAVAAEVAAATGRRVETVTADVTDRGAAQRIARFAHDHLPPVDILVNNAYAAAAVGSRAVDVADEDWDAMVAANVTTPAKLSGAFLDGMTARGGGSIINVLSGSGFLPSQGVAGYGVSKAALWMLTRYLAVEAAPAVRVNALCPGIVSPDGEPEHETQRQLLEAVPMRRLGRPEEMVGAALYLASDLAGYTTGEVIFANGGRPW